MFAALIALSATCIILTLSVIFLSFRLRSLSETRPRLKRRILRQEKNYQPRERVINIEDCCNMNICETVSEQLLLSTIFPIRLDLLLFVALY